jgi:anthranilate synthase component 2
MTLLVDNYDSFSYNLFQLIGAMDADMRVVRNDALSLEEIDEINPARIVLSPGPGRPANAGLCEDIVKRFAETIPILGVCLGHQAICEAFGASIVYAKTLKHGEASNISLDSGCALFRGLPNVISGARYHSLAVRENTLPAELLVTARAEDGEIMAVRHEKFPLYGLQFHPESILTPMGKHILQNFLDANRGTSCD